MSRTERRLSKRRWATALGVLGVFVVLFVVGAMDSSPPDDSDLLLEWPAVPAGNNGCEILEQLGDYLDFNDCPPDPSAVVEVEVDPETGETPLTPPIGPEIDDFAILLEGAPNLGRWKNEAYELPAVWDDECVDSILDAAVDAIVVFERSLRAPEFALAGPPDDPLVLLGDAAELLPPIWAWGEVTSALWLRSTRHFNEGRVEEAIEDCHRVIRFGGRLASARGTSFVYFFGANCASRGIVHLARILALSEPDVGRVRAALERLPPAAMPRDAGAGALLSCYRWHRTYLEASAIEEHASWKPDALFQSRRTRGWLAAGYRIELSNFDVPFAERQAAPGSAPAGLAGFLNFGGREYYSHAFGDEREFPLDVVAGAFLWSVTLELHRSFVALLAYQAEIGRLPAKLDDLVPTHLERVPSDAFDGQPLRYSLSDRELYSAGRVEKSLRHCRKQLTLRFDDYLPARARTRRR